MKPKLTVQKTIQLQLKGILDAIEETALEGNSVYFLDNKLSVEIVTELRERGFIVENPELIFTKGGFFRTGNARHSLGYIQWGTNV